MRMLTCLAVLALAIPANAGAGAAETFRPGFEAGQEHDWIVRFKHDLQILDVVQRRDDLEVEVSRGISGFIQNEVVVALRDRILEVEDGRPTLFRRRLRNCTGRGLAIIDQAVGRGRLELEFFSPLKGLDVLFTWVADEGDWSRRYLERNGTESNLGSLDGDAGLGDTLTREPVEVGTSWEVPPGHLRKLVAPGGNLHTWPKKLGNIFHRNVYMGVGGNIAELLEGEVVGFARATYQGRREVGGRSLGVVTYEVDLNCVSDKTERYKAAMPEEERANPTILERAYMTFRVQGTGELLWDFDAGHTRKYTFDGKQSVQGAVSKTSGLLVQDGGFPVTEEMRLEGDLRIEHEFAEPQDAEEE